MSQTTWEMPEEPTDVSAVTDSEGVRWEKHDEGYWKSRHGSTTWMSLLIVHGPLTRAADEVSA